MQGLKRGLGPLAGMAERGISTSATVQAALPAIAQQAPTSGGFLSKLFGGSSSRVVTPMTEPMEGVTLPPSDPPVTSPPKPEVTSLGNGMQIASENTPGPTAALGLYVNVGSVNETEFTAGASHLLEQLAFKSTQHRTHFRLVREVEAIGASVGAAASREQLVYFIDTTKATVPEALEILTDAVLNPKFTQWEVKAAAHKIDSDAKAIQDNPQTLILEGLHTVSFQGGLGRPLIAPPGAAARLSPDALSHFVAEHFTGGNMVLAAAGVDHGELAQLASPMLEGLRGGSAAKAPASKYVGGDFRTTAASPDSHAMLGFEVPGGWRDMRASVVATVMQYLLGGGGSFSSGGPGKGMHSRLYTRVLNQYSWVHNASAFAQIYNDTGVAGIYLTTDSGRIEEGVNIITKELQSLTKEVPAAELERAKRAALGTVLGSLESRAVVAEDIGRQILTYGHRKPIAEFVALLNEVSTADVAKLATRMLKTPPAFGGYGDTASMPRYDALIRRFS